MPITVSESRRTIRPRVPRVAASQPKEEDMMKAVKLDIAGLEEAARG
jgi:hypothetical protein